MSIGGISSRRASWVAATVISLLVIASCGGENTIPGTATTGARTPANSLSVFLMARDVEVGVARVPLVVLLADEDSTRLDDRLPELSFEYRYADDASLKPLPGLAWREWPVRGGAYVGAPVFDRPGIWEFQVTFDDGGSSRSGSAFLQVEESSSAPSVGEAAPITKTKTAGTIEEVGQISSALNPDPRFYSLSLDEALRNGRPTVVLFSTPAFCSTQTCGPQLDTLGELRETYGDRIDFIHVEIFDNIREMLDTGDSTIGRVAQPVEDWGLETEPWTFFVGTDGVITERFEQFTTLDELAAAAGALFPEN